MSITWPEWATNVTKRLDELSGRIDNIFKLMATESQVRSLRTDFDNLVDELVRELFLPKMQTYIVERLESKPLTQNEVAKGLPDFNKNRLIYHAFFDAWNQYEKAGIITPISRGRGHARLWQLFPEDDKEVQK